MRPCVRHFVLVGFTLLVAGLGRTALGQNILHVDASRPAGGDGASWATAFSDLQSALDEVAYGGKIWIAAGTYRPSKLTDSADPRSATFKFDHYPSVYGGFPPGGGDGTFGARYPDLYETVLTGDLLGNDTSTVATMADNAYHVCTVIEAAVPAVLDGLTIRSGNGPDDDHNGGGGVFGKSSNWSFQHCHFTRNRGRGGGATRAWGERYQYVDCLFTNNWSVWGSSIDIYSGDVTVLNCVFMDNKADYHASAIQCGRATLLVANCTFTRNEADSGAAMILYYTQAIVTNCTVIDHSGTSWASMFWVHRESDLTIANCILWNYHASIAPIYVDAGNTLSIHHTDIQGGRAGIESASGATVNWGAANINVDPQFQIPGNTNLQLSLRSPCVDVGDNSALPSDVLDFDGDADVSEPLPTDLLGLPRVVAATIGPAVPTVDMGAFEYQDDCNHNQVADSLDLATGVSQDCDNNLVPDECDPDADLDHVSDACDKCPHTPDPEQEDTDGDLIGNACDNCPFASNLDQTDLDFDGMGDACDDDMDGDAVLNAADNCPRTVNRLQEDADGDGRGDACDVCPDTIAGAEVDENGCPPDYMGDMDRDGDVDMSDFGLFQMCLTGNAVPQTEPGCRRARLDAGDTDVDSADFAIFRKCFSGTDIPPIAACR